MGFQTTVYKEQATGVQGELFDFGPMRVQPYTIVSPSAANNIFGNVFTKTSEGVVQAGGTGEFAGFLVNPKTASSYGTAVDGPLAPTLTVANYVIGEVLIEGCIFVYLPAPANLGSLVVYNTTTGALATISPGDELPTGTKFAYASVDRFTVTQAGLAVITVRYNLTVPSPSS